jgi:hypothetical protein
MKVKDWLDGFVVRHRRRHPRDDWPESEAFERLWLDAMLGMQPKPRQAEAEAASASLRGEALAFPEDHPLAVVAAIELARSKPTVAGAADREEAARQSRDCPYCGGEGMTVVYHPRYDGEPVVEATIGGETRKIASRPAAHCVCALGRWMRSKTKPEVLRRVFDLVEVLEGRFPPWLAEDPRPGTFDLPPGGWRRLKDRLAGELQRAP